MFLYFVPRAALAGGQWATPAALKYVGQPGETWTNRETMAGPEGSGAGFVCAMAPNAERVQYIADKQTWLPIYQPDPAAVPIYVGRWNEDKLEPATLQRPAMRESHNVTLGDGSVWAAAIARGFEAETAQFYTPLPRELTYDPKTGQWKHGRVSAEYRRFLDLAFDYADAADAAARNDQNQFAFPAVDEFAIGALAVNYRIGPSELALYPGAYTVTARDALIRAALDMPTLERWMQKKTEAAAVGSAMSASAEPSPPEPPHQVP